MKKVTTQLQASRRARTEKATEAARAAGKLFQPGQSGNPGGRPTASRNRLQGNFLRALADDFDQHGRAAIRRMREEDPAAYVRVVAQLMPKEFEINRPLDGLTDDELYAAIDRLRSQLAQERASESPPDGSPTIDESPTKH